MTPNSTRKKKNILKKKIEDKDKKKITDIRKFWKNIDKGDKDNDILTRQEETTKMFVDKRSVMMKNDPGKLHNNTFIRTECAKAEFDFD